MSYLIKKKNRFQLEIIVINLTILCFLFRMSIPFLKYPFILLYFGLMGHVLINFRKQLSNSIKVYFHTYKLLILLLILLLLAGFLFSNKLYLIVFKDSANIFILLSVFYLMSHIILIRNELDKYVNNFVKFIILFAIIISINLLGNLFSIFPENRGLSLLGIHLNPSNVLANIDYNFGILPVIFGLVALIYLLITSDYSYLQKFIFNILLIFFSLSIFFSGSRRGLFTFAIIIISIAVMQIISFFNKNEFLLRNRSRLLFFICSIFILTISSWYVIKWTPYSFKNNFLHFVGCKNLPNTKLNITTLICRINSTINPNTSFYEIYDNIWTPGFNSKDPESTWGTVNHKTIFPLVGDNVGIVPDGAKGNLIDSTCISGYSESGDYTDFISSIVNLKVNAGERYKVSIFCYVSEDLDVDQVRLTVPTDYIIQKKVLGNAVSTYDLSKKNTWEKLEIEFECYVAEVPVYISFLKRGVKDFSHIKGHIIFAYPSYEKVNISDKKISSKVYKPEPDHYLSIIHYNTTSLPKINKYHYASSVSLPFTLLIEKSNPQIDFDPIRNLASKLISEDTTYYPYKSNLIVDTVYNSFTAPRFVRWKFALDIFLNEYNWRQKISGGGFNFLNWYGYVFFHDKTRSDYPHNPFLSVLLYSGIFGLTIYLILMYKVFYYYYKYFNEYKILAIFFLITFFFSFFSAGSPFDPPIMGFFNILPFFIHAVHKRSAGHRAEGSGEE